MRRRSSRGPGASPGFAVSAAPPDPRRKGGPPPAPPARNRRQPAPRPVEPGAPPPPAPKFRYLVLWKPYGVLTRFTDQEGRPTLKGLMPVPDVHAVGRLDADSEGALLFTDDPAFQRALTKPGSDHGKLYLVQVEREPDEMALAALRNGVVLDGRETLPAEAALIPEPELPERPVPIRYRKDIPTAWLELVLFEGRNRQVRRMTAAVGHPTLRLVRWAVGPVTLEGMAPGQWRHFRPDELKWARSVAAEGLRKTTPRAWQTFAEPGAPPRASGIPFQGGRTTRRPSKPGGSRRSGDKPDFSTEGGAPAKPGARREGGRPTGKPAGRPGGRPSGKPEGPRPTGIPEGRREPGEGRREGPRPAGKPEGRREGPRPAGKPEGRREGPRPAGKPEGRREGPRPAGKPDGRGKGGAGRKPRPSASGKPPRPKGKPGPRRGGGKPGGGRKPKG